MRKIFFKIFILLNLVLFLSFPLKSKALVMPSVHVSELSLNKVEFSAGEEIKGSFVVSNEEERVINDITFEYLLFIKDENGLPGIYVDEKLSGEKFNIASGEKRSFEFSYNLPQNLTSGNYVFRVALFFSSGMPLGWEEREIKILSNRPFLLLDFPTLIKEGVEEHPTVGVVFEKEGISKIKFTVKNPTQETLTAIPKIEIYERSTTQKKLEEKLQPEITLKPQQSLTLEYDLPTYSKPESYLALVQLFNRAEQPISNILYFRWVVAGESGKIHEISTDKEMYSKGEVAKITILVTGRADMAEIGEQGEVEVTLLAPNHVEVGKVKKTINFDEGYHIIEVPIREDVSRPIVKVTLTKNGLTLDEYSVQTGRPILPPVTIVTPKAKPSQNKTLIWSLIGIGLIVLISLLVYYFKKQKSKTLIILILVLFTLAFFFPKVTIAAVEEFVQAPSLNYIGTVWNKPRKNQVFVIGDTITFQGAFFVPACSNTLVEGTTTFYITDHHLDSRVFFKQDLPDKKSEDKKKEILTSGKWVKLGSIHFPPRRGGTQIPSFGKGVLLEYNASFKIPNEAPTGKVYARILLEAPRFSSGRLRDLSNIIISEEIEISSPQQPPTATNLSVDQIDYCKINYPNAIFSWQYSSLQENDYQTAYQIQIIQQDNNSIVYDSGKINSQSHSFTTPPETLSWNKSYYWRLMVWNSKDQSSGWISGPPFTTPKHPYPKIDFSLTPESPSAEEEVQFFDKSEVFGGAQKVSFAWQFENATPSSSTEQNPKVKFLSPMESKITLKVTDSDGYSCSGEKKITVKPPLPKWIEF